MVKKVKNTNGKKVIEGQFFKQIKFTKVTKGQNIIKKTF